MTVTDSEGEDGGWEVDNTNEAWGDDAGDAGDAGGC